MSDNEVYKGSFVFHKYLWNTLKSHAVTQVPMEHNLSQALEHKGGATGGTQVQTACSIRPSIVCVTYGYVT